MEEEQHEQNPLPVTEQLQARANKFIPAFGKIEKIIATIGTTEFQGPEKYSPPKEDHPEYLKELIKTTIASSEVKRKLARQTLPALEQMYNSLQGEITQRQHLLQEAAEYKMDLYQLREFEREGYLTNTNVIGLVEDALQKIDEELHRSSPVPDIAQKDGNIQKKEQETPQDKQKEDSDALRPDGIRKLQSIFDNVDIDTFSQIINEGRQQQYTSEHAARLLNGIFTKLYWRVFDGKANEQEKELWNKIGKRSGKMQLLDIRDDFHSEIERYIKEGPRKEPPPTPTEDPKSPIRLEKRVQGSHEKKQIDPSILIQRVLRRITERGAKVGMNQHFNPVQAYEVFGITQDSVRDSVEKGYVAPEKREGNDYHPAFTLPEGIQLAVIRKFKGATREQIEELPVLIELELEKWIKEHPDTISAK